MQFISHLTADEAARRRKQERDTLQPGEYIGFNYLLVDGEPSRGSSGVFLTDAATPGAPKSIDTALQEAIASAAKGAGMKPSEWLAKQSQRTIEQLVETTAKAAVQAAGAEGIAKTFAKDSVERARRAWMRDKATAYARKPQHNAPGPVAQPTADAAPAPKPQTETAARAAIADARAARCARLSNAYKG